MTSGANFFHKNRIFDAKIFSNFSQKGAQVGQTVVQLGHTFVQPGHTYVQLGQPSIHSRVTSTGPTPS